MDFAAKRVRDLSAVVRKSAVARAALLASLVQVVVLFTIEALIAARHQSQMRSFELQLAHITTNKSVFTELSGLGRALTVYHVIFMLATLFQLYIMTDAVLSQNSIELVALNTINLGLFGYAITQMFQDQNFAEKVNDAFSKITPAPTPLERSQTIVVINVVACAIFVGVGAWLSWKLHREFGWQIYKRIGADISLRKQMMTYFFIMMLLKLDVFFYFTFSLQFLVVVVLRVDDQVPVATTDIVVHIAMSLIMIVVLLYTCVRGVRQEIARYMYVFMAGSVVCLGYLIYKMAQIHNNKPDDQRRFYAVRNSLTFAISICIILAMFTLVNAVLCTRNFGRGLKRHIDTAAHSTTNMNAFGAGIGGGMGPATDITIGEMGAHTSSTSSTDFLHHNKGANIINNKSNPSDTMEMMAPSSRHQYNHHHHYSNNDPISAIAVDAIGSEQAQHEYADVDLGYNHHNRNDNHPHHVQSQLPSLSTFNTGYSSYTTSNTNVTAPVNYDSQRPTGQSQNSSMAGRHPSNDFTTSNQPTPIALAPQAQRAPPLQSARLASATPYRTSQNELPQQQQQLHLQLQQQQQSVANNKRWSLD